MWFKFKRKSLTPDKH